MKKTYLLAASAALFMHAQAQDCSDGRYSEEIFNTYSIESDVVYGSNLDYEGQNVTLLLDIYTPDGDTETERPLLIFIHGGSFVGGSKTQGDIVGLAQEYAKKGYVTSAINYRLGMNGIPFPGPNQSDASEAVMRATQDSRAAVRFFRKSIEDEGNPYGLHTDHIYLVGYSAGGFVALHHAHLDKEAEVPAFIDQSKPGLGGGIEGLSGNAGYSSEVTAIVSLAGAIGELEWIEADGAPILSLHGDNDATVPYGSATINLLGFYPIMEVHGSGSIHPYTETIDLKNCFKSFAGLGHNLHLENAAYYDTTSTYINQWLQHFVCDTDDYCYEYVLSVDEMNISNLQLYPNPAREKLNISADELIAQVMIRDLNGKLVLSDNPLSNFATLSTDALPQGMYLVEVRSILGASKTQKLIIQ
jgi:pimeloyl-ACP methyl ester carboxylesterase